MEESVAITLSELQWLQSAQQHAASLGRVGDNTLWEVECIRIVNREIAPRIHSYWLQVRFGAGAPWRSISELDFQDPIGLIEAAAAVATSEREWDKDHIQQLEDELDDTQTKREELAGHTGRP